MKGKLVEMWDQRRLRREKPNLSPKLLAALHAPSAGVINPYECDRGAKYAKQEFTDPRRELSTTVEIVGAHCKRLPVKVAGPVNKGRILEAARKIHTLQVKAPVKLGQVLIEDLLGNKGIKVVACRSMVKTE